MDIHERLAAFWAGERPDRIPIVLYSVLWRQAGLDLDLSPLFERGMGLISLVAAFDIEYDDVEVIDEEDRVDGRRGRRQTMRCPEGEVSQAWSGSWRRSFLLETPEDYRVMTAIARRTRVVPNIERVRTRQAQARPYEIICPTINRTPLQTMLVDYAGLENFGLHLSLYEDEVRALYDALLRIFIRKVEITAEAPGVYVSNLENFTADSLGPRRFEEFLLPVYEQCFPILHEAGKIVGCHYDGHTRACAEAIARSPINLIESLTEPPEGDLTLNEARAAWPDKLFWCNINAGDYALPPDRLRARVKELIDRGAADGRLLALEISEQFPCNWKESIPAVLDAIDDYPYLD